MDRGTANNIAGARNACKQAALNRTVKCGMVKTTQTPVFASSLVCMRIDTCSAVFYGMDSLGWFSDVSSVGSFQLRQTRMSALSDNLALGCGRKA